MESISRSNDRPRDLGERERRDVLIVGGGVVGLSAALFLQRHGVQPLLIERHPSTSIHPRARGVNVRVMELYRAIGLEARVREAGRATPISLGLLQGESLAQALAPPLGRWLRAALNALARRHLVRPRGSPTQSCRVTQDHLEPVLAEAARERGAELRFSTELTSLEPDGSGVTAEVLDRPTGERRRVRARYLIAADGARSPIRQRLGIGTSSTQAGTGTFGHLLNVLFEADLASFVRGREFSMALIHRPEVRGLFATINNRERWVFHILYDANRESPQDYPPDRCAELIRLALGAGDIALHIKSVLPWECAARVADRYRVGRVLLAGDAAHLLPPWGGLGANTGIADAWDLAWKLAQVVKGEADDSLLDSYELERRPVGVAAAEDSAANTDPQGLMAPFSWRRLVGRARGSRSGPPVPSKLVKLAGLGWQYRSPLVAEEATPTRPWKLDGRPGTRLPHGWIGRAGERISSLDLVGERYALLVARDGGRFPDRRVQPAGGDGPGQADGEPPFPLDVRRAGVDFDDPGDRWQRAARIFPDGALLVRPDGVVAWRAPGGAPPADAQASLAQAWPRHVSS